MRITLALTLAAGGVAAVLTAASPDRSATSSLDDATIVAIFDAANTADIETGSLAAERAQRADVREYAEMLARDHKAVRQLGRDLAQRLGVTPTPPADSSMAVAHRAALAKLRSTKPADFDRAFLTHEMTFHENVIEAINGTLLPAIRNEELKGLVLKVAPAFESHRLAAKHLMKK